VQVIFTVRVANWLKAALLDLHFSIWKKNRLISLTDSGCLGYFLFIKAKLPSVASGVPSDVSPLKVPLLKKANCCLHPGETWRGLTPERAGGSCSRSFPPLSVWRILLLSPIFHAIINSANPSEPRRRTSGRQMLWAQRGQKPGGSEVRSDARCSWGRTTAAGKVPSPGRAWGSGGCWAPVPVQPFAVGCPAARPSSGGSGTIVCPGNPGGIQ